MVCSTPELRAKEIDYLNKVLCRNSYPDWFLKKPNHRHHMDQNTNQETTKKSFVTVPHIQGLSKEFIRIFKDTKVPNNLQKMQYTLNSVNASQRQNSNTVVPRCGLSVDLC